MTAELSLWDLIKAGGMTMLPLGICSLAAWAIIFERLWRYRGLGNRLGQFQLEATNALLRKDWEQLRGVCARSQGVPTATLIGAALERLGSGDERVRASWREAVERRRQLANQELRQNLWVLGTIGSAAPFIGLLGTVIGILRSFEQMARTGAGGFNVVAAGISESLIATAAGLVVGIVAVMAYNAFQNWIAGVVLRVRLQAEELTELLGRVSEAIPDGATR